MHKRHPLGLPGLVQLAAGAGVEAAGDLRLHSCRSYWTKKSDDPPNVQHEIDRVVLGASAIFSTIP